jgi:hypothetical protein
VNARRGSGRGNSRGMLRPIGHTTFRVDSSSDFMSALLP